MREEMGTTVNGRPGQCCVLGVHVSGLTVPELHSRIAFLIENEQRALVLNVNVHALNLAYKRPWLREFLNRAHLVFCDGAGVVFGARILGCDLGRRITYADWMWQLAAFCEQHGFALFFLGARRGVAERAAAALKARYPGLRVAGTQHGYFDRTPGSPENQAVLRQINAVEPDILVVGLGMPAQERWLMENWERVQANVALTGGAVFDYLSGDLRRAPRWMTDHGLEWLGRLLIEPRRLWRRYVVGNPLFLWRVLGQRLGLLEIE
jgi:N-acetylglucosaminyldiphosphoundecaprenol N-acetyl-beta-D-mannosaminyltransferase